LIDNLEIKWVCAVGNLRSGSAKIIVPKVESVRGRVLKTMNIKPALGYLEVHLVDHCNLNCKGCDHLSPIADKWFADPNIYERDLKQLQKLFSGIRTICLMGGEPLLHPDVSRFLFITRSNFPKTNLQVMTNGLILDRMPDSFWKSCKETSAEIILDVYPPIYQKEESLVNLAKTKGVRMITRKVQSFQSFINLKGDSDPDKGFQKCPFRFNHQLKEGKLFTCVMPMVVHYFNKRFGTNLPSGGWVDIYAPNLTGWDVKKMLNQGSFSTCRYCSTKPEQLASASFQWTTSELKMSEWDVSTCR
jgi:4Fe-4S single cluster domain/Radical SAM superfamily